MKCPYCGSPDSRVIDSRAVGEGTVTRRRRECPQCSNRFTTMEKAEQEPIVVIKRDGRRELFDRNKLMTGLILAGQKRNISRLTWEQLVEQLERELRSVYLSEVPSDRIGELVLDKLRYIDEVAYVRFASVFRQFPDIRTFKEELDKMFSARQRQPVPDGAE